MQRAFASGARRRVTVAASGVALLVLGMASFASVDAPKSERASAWRDRAITIDGSDGDWAGLTTPYPGTHVSLGFVNDADSLYFCLLAKHEATRVQIEAAGLIVWIDPGNGKKYAFGIRCPSARSVPMTGWPPPDPREGWRAEIDILGPGKSKSRTVPLDQAGGIEARGGMSPDLFVYELRVPLVPGDDHPYAVGAGPGQLVRATIETPEYRGPYPRTPLLPGGSLGIVVGGGVTNVGGSVGGVPFAAVPIIPTPVNIQTTVRLAAR